MEIDVTKCEYYTISGGCMSNGKECWFECCSKNNNCKFKQLERYKQAIEEIEEISKEAGNTEYLTFPDFNLKQNAKMLIGQFNGYLEQIIQKCEEVSEFKSE